VFSTVLLSQSLKLSSASALPGDSVGIEITLASPACCGPQILQWETTIPAARLTFLDDPLQAGPAAQASDKSATCADKAGPPETRTLVCILAGGLKTIPDGVVARLRLRILPTARPGTAQVETTRGIAVLLGLKEVALPAAATTVTVHRDKEK